MTKPSKEKNLPSRRLLIMRHAKSDWDMAAATDFDRPLNKRGERDAPCMGQWLRKNKLIPDWIISSPALRAKETVLLVCEELGLKKKAIHWEEKLYAAELKTLLTALAQCPEDRHLVMLVGHNPGLEELLVYLTGMENRMPTAAIACIQLPQNWGRLKRGSGQLETLIFPKALAD